MAFPVRIEFDDLLQHTYDPAFVEISGGLGKLKSLVDPDEVLFSNFDTDGNKVSKRGAKTIVMSGADNTGVVLGGVLKFPNQDRSRAAYQGITSIVDDFAFRAKCITNQATFTANRDLVRLLSNVDLSEIRFYIGNQGAGAIRVYRQIKNSAGTIISDVILATPTFSIGSEFNIAFSCDADGVTRTFYNGVQTHSGTSPTFNFTNCELRFGNNVKSVCSFDNVQLFKSDAITANFTYPFPEPTTYSLVEQQIVTDAPFLMDALVSFSDNKEFLNGSLVKHHIIKNVDRYSVVAGSWELMNPLLPLLPQSNDASVINDNAETFPLVVGIGAYVRFVTMLMASPDGYTTPVIDFIEFSFRFYFKVSAVVKCIVYGEITDNGGNPVEGAVVEFDSKDILYDNTLKGPKIKFVTGPDGQWSMPLIETVSTASDGDFKFTYLNDGVEVVKVYKRRIIPLEGTKKFKDLLVTP